MQSAIDNWKVLQELLEKCLESKLEREIRPQIIGVSHQMTTFEYYFGVKLGSLLLKHSDNLSKTLQKTKLSAAEGQSVASLTVKTLEKMRTDDSYHLFWERCNKEAKDLEIFQQRGSNLSAITLEMNRQNFWTVWKTITDLFTRKQ